MYDHPSTSTSPEAGLSAPFVGRGKGHVGRSRASVYSLLAKALSGPDETLFAAVEDGSFHALLSLVSGRLRRTHSRTAEQSAHLARSLGSSTSPRSGLVAEYTRLLVTDLVCPHYEADYVSSHVFMTSQSIANVAGFYAAFGLRTADDARERADGIAVELDFMNFLATKEAHALSREERRNAALCRRAQTRFFSNHLGRWGRPFAQMLAHRTRILFHGELARLLEAFLIDEADYLGLTLENLERECAVLSPEHDPRSIEEDASCSGCARGTPEEA